MKCSETRSLPLDQGYLRFPSEIGSSKFPADEDASIPQCAPQLPTPVGDGSLGGPPMHQTLDGFIAVRIGTLRLRVYYPSKERPLPALVYLHGGGWTLFDLDTHDRIMRDFAASTRWAVVGIDYPSPQTRFPGALEASVETIEAFDLVATRLGSIGATTGAIRQLLRSELSPTVPCATPVGRLFAAINSSRTAWRALSAASASSPRR